MKRTYLRTLGAIALLTIVLGVSMTSFSAGPPPASLSVYVTATRITSSEAFDTVLYVAVPRQQPINPTFNLYQSFVVQSIDFTETHPDGSVDGGNLITCSLSGPAYPSRNAVLTCSGSFTSRVNGLVYPGSTTGIYFVGFGGFGPGDVGRWTYTYTVTGLYYGAVTTLTSSFTSQVTP